MITFHTHHQRWVYWKEQHFPIHQMKPCQLDWQKLVFLEKIGSVQEKLSSLMKIKQNEKSTFIYKAGVWSGKYISFATMGKIGKEDGQLQKPPEIYNQMPKK